MRLGTTAGTRRVAHSLGLHRGGAALTWVVRVDSGSRSLGALLALLGRGGRRCCIVRGGGSPGAVYSGPPTSRSCLLFIVISHSSIRIFTNWGSSCCFGRNSFLLRVSQAARSFVCIWVGLIRVCFSMVFSIFPRKYISRDCVFAGAVWGDSPPVINRKTFTAFLFLPVPRPPLLDQPAKR